MTEAYSHISQASPKRPTLIFSGGLNLVGMPSKAASSGREKNRVLINIQDTREYLEYGNQVSLLSIVTSNL